MDKFLYKCKYRKADTGHCQSFINLAMTNDVRKGIESTFRRKTKKRKPKKRKTDLTTEEFPLCHPEST